MLLNNVPNQQGRGPILDNLDIGTYIVHTLVGASKNYALLLNILCMIISCSRVTERYLILYEN